jgi:hypothetical protein
MTKPTRDYKAEYAKRIARGLSQGLSRSQARGHPKPREIQKRVSAKPPKFDRRLEEGFKALRNGQTLAQSAKSVHVSPERLRRYIAETGIAHRQGRRWIIGPDTRPRIMRMFSDGEVIVVTVDPLEASIVGKYLDAVGDFLNSNNPGFLRIFVDESVTDINGKTHPFETDPNVLYRLDATGGGSFEDVYRIVV